MPRRGPRDVNADRQRALFGVDRLERHVADITVELLRLVNGSSDTNSVSRETTHVERMQNWLVLYTDMQRSDFELRGGSDGKKK